MSRVGAPAATPVLAQIKVGCLRAGDCAGASQGYLHMLF